MIITYHPEEEPSPEFGCRIPVSLRLMGGSLEISYLPDAKKIAEDYAAAAASDGRPFDMARLKALCAACAALPSSRGFSYEEPPEEMLYAEYRVPDARELNVAAILPESVPLARKHLLYRNLTELDLAAALREGRLGYVVTDGLRVVSAAIDNFGDGDNEIAVETDGRYRRRGYGASNTAALCRRLLRRGQTVSYLTRETNAASAALAGSCGLKRCGGQFFCVLTEDD